jgi:hypothetical protein
LQVPLDTRLRDQAEKVAVEAGFSSLQELVRVFLTKMSQRKIEFGFSGDVVLSEKAEQRYIKTIADVKAGKNIATAETYDELMAIVDGE